jgi:hypothetical protein
MQSRIPWSTDYDGNVSRVAISFMLESRAAGLAPSAHWGGERERPSTKYRLAMQLAAFGNSILVPHEALICGEYL